MGNRCENRPEFAVDVVEARVINRSWAKAADPSVVRASTARLTIFMYTFILNVSVKNRHPLLCALAN